MTWIVEYTSDGKSATSPVQFAAYERAESYKLALLRCQRSSAKGAEVLPAAPDCTLPVDRGNPTDPAFAECTLAVNGVTGRRILKINSTVYLWSRKGPGLIEIVKTDGTLYTLRLRERGWSCDCPQGKIRCCKHLVACECVGLLNRKQRG